jgi:HAD superfamily hydrolase (TIGR01509 family)
VYQALLFDMDGVVVDTESSVADFWQELARADGRTLTGADLERDVYGRQAEHTLAALFPYIPPDRYGEVYRRMRANQESLDYAEVPGVRALLGELSAARVPLALVTGAEEFKVVAVLDQLGLTEVFDAVIGAEHVATGKPHPGCYLAAARLLDLDIHRCAVFEDAVSGVTSAVAAGARCVAVAPPQRADRVRAAGAAWVIPDFRQVSFSAVDRTLWLDPGTPLPLAPSRPPSLARLVTPGTDGRGVRRHTAGAAARSTRTPTKGAGMQVTARPLLDRAVDRWDPAAADGLSGRDEVLYRSHLVGADPALTKEGGGNFSAKGVAVDHRGTPTEVLWMSAWGCDGATATPAEFPALRLDDLRLLRTSGPLSERELLDFQLACGLRGEQRPPGIETLTHAFIPAAHVDHTHPDAVVALTAIPDGRRRAEEEFGDEAIWFDYRQYDLGVAQELADRIAANPRCRYVLLANHGLFTWAETSEQCYRNSLEAVERAAAAVEKAVCRAADLGGPAVDPLPARSATNVLVHVLPALRGALSHGSGPVVLHVDRSPEAVEFASSARGLRLTRLGPGCPDHLPTVGYRPLITEVIRTTDDAAVRAVLAGVESHRRWYGSYYENNISEAGCALGRRSDAPRVVILPGIGVVSSGPDAARARLAADHIRQTMTVIRAADAAGGYTSLTEAQGLADEYWPLIRFKPQLAPPAGFLAGKVFLVVGGGDTATLAVAEGLAAADAHVAMASEDVEQMAAAAAEICRRHGERQVVALPDGTRRLDGAVNEAVLAYGGFDALVDMSGSVGLARVARQVIARQCTGGAVLLADADTTADELRWAVEALEADGLTVGAVTSVDPAVVVEAAVVVAMSKTWKGMVLEPCRPDSEEDSA